MTNCDSIFNLLLIFETIHPFAINFASDRKEFIKVTCENGFVSVLVLLDRCAAFNSIVRNMLLQRL